jgi:hypothetical protein
MFDRTERERHSTRWIAWMPLLFVSAFLYWSVALGLGGLSLMAAGTLGCHPNRLLGEASAVEPMPGQLSGEPIIVHLQESAEPDDDQDTDALLPTIIDVSVDDGTGSLPAHSN